MSKKKKKDYDNTRYTVEEVIDTLSEGKCGWGKRIVRGYMDDNPSTIDVRYLKIDEEDGSYRPGKGISLSDEDCDGVVNALVRRGFGSSDVLSSELERRERVYGKTSGKLRLDV